MLLQASVPAQMSAVPATPQIAQGLIAPEQLEKLLPPSVYFQGQSAPLQLRNAAGVKTVSGIVWAALVDTSGYSSGVRERYQFILVTETHLTIGGRPLPAGVYGAGFLSDGTFLVMDIGGHTLEQGRVESDSALKRPRPLQMTSTPGGLRLYLGRQFVTVEPAGGPVQ